MAAKTNFWEFHATSSCELCFHGMDHRETRRCRRILRVP